jgi:hypothetical protein
MGKGGGGGGLDIDALADKQAELNRINTFSPFGSQMFGTSLLDSEGNIVFAPNVGDDQAAMRVIESPFQQQQRDRMESIGGTLSNSALSYAQGLPSGMPSLSRIGSTPSLGMIGHGPNLQSSVSDINMGGMQAAPTLRNYGADTDKLEQATFQRGANLLNPGFERGRERLEQRLADRGMARGSKGWTRDMDDFERRKGEQFENLALSSVGAGRGEHSRLFGLGQSARGQQFGERSRLFDTGVTRAGFGNEAQQNMMQNARSRIGMNNATSQQQFANQLTQADFNNRANLTERSTGFNELSGLMGQTPSMPLPNFQGPGAIDVMGPAISQHNAQQANRASGKGGFMNALGTLGGAAIKKSSREWKDHIEPVDRKALLQKVRNLPLNWWRYKPLHGDPALHIGTFSEDFNAIAQGLGAGSEGKTIDMMDHVGVLLGAVQELTQRVMDIEAATRPSLAVGD